MMKIGIITIHHVNNFGAVLQAYALSGFLRQRGFDAEIIDYRPPAAEEFYRPKLRLTWPVGIRTLIRWHRTSHFVHRHLSLSATRYSCRDDFAAKPPEYDAYIAGSDQIWCTAAGSFRGYDPVFFLDIPISNTARRIAYAASAGQTHDFGPDRPAIRAALQKFDSIMVRDSNTTRLVKQTTGIDAQEVLDPIFLTDFSQLLPGPDNTKRGRPYLLIYGSISPRVFRLTQQIAQRRGLTVRQLNNMILADPRVFVRKMKDAAFVVSSNFHGVAFACKFGKPVIAYANARKRTKITDLLDRLGLQDRVISQNEDIPAVNQIDCDVDKDEVSSRVAALCEHSKARLLEAVTGLCPNSPNRCA